MQLNLIEQRPDIDYILSRIARAEHAFLKFLSANDLGLTNSHQSGIYLSRDCWPLFFTEAGRDGENLERKIFISWNQENPAVFKPSGFSEFSASASGTEAMVRWYGRQTRGEYRLTRTNAFFRGRQEMFLGSLFILLPAEQPEIESGFHEFQNQYFEAFVLEYEQDITAVMDFSGITPAETGGLLRFDLEQRILPELEKRFSSEQISFPDTETIAGLAQDLYRKLYSEKRSDEKIRNADSTLIKLIEIEYTVFRYIERKKYADQLSRPFSGVDEFLALSLEINNRRKSRAGKSLELHLKYIFETAGISFSHGAITKNQKRPDFLFPSLEAFEDMDFAEEKLFFLAAKTTCKDRWRQILTEAERVSRIYLFTLQQGISSLQLDEMEREGVTPVIPAEYHSRCKPADRNKLLTLAGFLNLLGNTETLDLFSSLSSQTEKTAK